MVFADEHGGDRLDPHKYTSHTPLVAMSSRPPPDLYCKFKANTSSITLKTGNKRKKFKASTLYWHCIKTSNISVGGREKSAMADATKTTARHIGHMTYTQAPAVYEKNIFHLFRFTQPVKNHSLFTYFIYIEILMHITYLLAGHTIVQNYGKLLTYVPISRVLRKLRPTKTKT